MAAATRLPPQEIQSPSSWAFGKQETTIDFTDEEIDAMVSSFRHRQESQFVGFDSLRTGNRNRARAPRKISMDAVHGGLEAIARMITDATGDDTMGSMLIDDPNSRRSSRSSVVSDVIEPETLEALECPDFMEFEVPRIEVELQSSEGGRPSDSGRSVHFDPAIQVEYDDGPQAADGSASDESLSPSGAGDQPNALNGTADGAADSDCDSVQDTAVVASPTARDVRFMIPSFDHDSMSSPRVSPTLCGSGALNSGRQYTHLGRDSSAPRQYLSQGPMAQLVNMMADFVMTCCNPEDSGNNPFQVLCVQSVQCIVRLRKRRGEGLCREGPILRRPRPHHFSYQDRFPPGSTPPLEKMPHPGSWATKSARLGVMVGNVFAGSYALLIAATQRTIS